jgi:hypothetical protein
MQGRKREAALKPAAERSVVATLDVGEGTRKAMEIPCGKAHSVQEAVRY